MTIGRSHWAGITCLILTGISAVFISQGRCEYQGGKPGASVGHQVQTDDLPWKPVPAAEVMQTLELLAGQCTGNLQRLTTWEGSFNCTLKQKIRRSSLPAEYAKKIQSSDVVWVRQESIFDVNFAADLASNRLYNSKKTTSFKYVDDKTGKTLLDDLVAYDENSAFTEDHFVRFAPKEVWPGYVEVSKGEKPRTVHLGFQEAPIKGRIENNLGIVNPSVLFGFSSVRKFGEELSLYADFYSGKNGRDFQEFFREHLKIYLAAVPAGRYYKLEVAMKQMPEGSKLLDRMRMIFSPETGYNPVSLLIESEVEGGARRPRMKAAWSWQSIDGIFVPARITQEVFTPDTGDLSYESTYVLGKSTLNGKLDESRFSYAALGMLNGDILDDMQTQTRYKYMDGKLDKLASDAIHMRNDFDSNSAADNYARTRFMLVVTSIIGLLIVYALIRARAGGAKAAR